MRPRKSDCKKTAHLSKTERDVLPRNWFKNRQKEKRAFLKVVLNLTFFALE
jgi:hypothetical protein